jgi:hypothetical protein
MNRSENPASAMPYDQIHFFAKFQGAGNANLTVATTTFSATSSLAFMHRSNNFASTATADAAKFTHTGTGLYTVPLSDTLPVILDMDPNVWGADGKQATIVDYNPTTRTVSLRTVNAAGTLTDLATTDFLILTIVGTKSVPTY